MLKARKVMIVVGCVVMLAGYGAVVGQTLDPNDESGLLRQVSAELDLLRNEVKRLREQVVALQRRVDQIELAGSARLRPPGDTHHVMRVEGVETRTGDLEAVQEADQLRREANELEKKAREKDDEIAQNRRQRTPSYTDRYGRPLPNWKERSRKWQVEQKRERESLRESAVAFRSEAKKKKGQAIRLEKKSKELRQVIRGWDGERTVILETSRDLSRKLRDLTPESCLEWTGTISRSDEDSETWTVRMVKLVECPTGLNKRRAGNKLSEP